MNAIDFVVRAPMGGTRRGTVGGETGGFVIEAGTGNEISLHLGPAEVASYERAANDLLIALPDGRVIVLEGYFDGGAAGANRLFLSGSGDLSEVTLTDVGSGSLVAQYAPPESFGKWSPSDQLVFFDRPSVSAPPEEDVSMFGAPLLGPVLGGLGWGGAAVGAGIVGAGVIGGGGDGGGGSGGGGASGWPDPTIDNPGVPIGLNGGDTPLLPITGTAPPGSDVTVAIGDATITVQPDEDGFWEAIFAGETFPGEGTYPVVADVTAPDGGETSLPGPVVTVDTTPPTLEVSTGTVSTGDYVNADDHPDGPQVTGTTEPGATVVITIGETDYPAVVTGTGDWSISFDDVVLPEGEYIQDIVVTATDPVGNTTVAADGIAVDTIPHPLTIDPVGGDDMITAEDAVGGIEITGTSTPGAAVTVTFGSVTGTVTTQDDGTWTLVVSEEDVQTGTYDTIITATTEDAAGNASSAQSQVQVDTEGAVEITGIPLTGDDLISAVEHAAGVTLTGTSEAGSSVEVTIGDVTQTATVDPDGGWTVTFDDTLLESGTYTVTAIATATDSVGNVSTDAHSFVIDTQIGVTLDEGLAGGDNIVNAAESGDGFAISGTADAGATVEVVFQSVTHTATATESGTWQVMVPAADIAAGTYEAGISVTATDPAGNTSTTSGSVQVDTQVRLSFSTDGLEGDGVVNAVERADGITLTGTTDPDCSVAVTLGGVTVAATVAADGGWSATFAAAALPEGQTTVGATAVATDPAGNTASAGADIRIDTLVENFAHTSTPGGGDGVINAEEAAQGLILTGTTEIGASVTVTLATATVEASVADDGTWSASISAADLPQGETTVPLSVSSTDVAGNTETIEETVTVDTVAGTLTISPEPVEGDDVVNAAEASDGVTLTGTSDPGQPVVVTMAGVSKTVTTDDAGNWSVSFASDEVAPGTYTADITATITDPAGNRLTRTDSVRVDTEVQNFAVTSLPIEGEDVVNAAEASDGIVLSGTTEIGASVTVTVAGVGHAASVDAAGNWSVTVPAADLPPGQYDTAALVSTTDAAGNTAEISAPFRVDTLVDTLSMEGPVTADGVVNRAEAAAGVILSGAVEAGSEVVVTVGGLAHVAVVSGTSWSVTIPETALPQGEATAEVLIEATDAAGNTRSETASFEVDTTPPELPDVESYTRDLTGLRGISIETQEDAIDIGQVVEAGGVFAIESVDGTSFDIPALDETNHAFAQTVADGSHLVVRATDAAGNQSSTYLVTEDPRTSEVVMTDQLAAELGAFNVGAIDLQFAEDSTLTLTEAQLLALSSNDNVLTIQGGSDDTVTITGAQATGTQTGADGQTLNVYSLGDATVMIEDDITTVTI